MHFQNKSSLHISSSSSTPSPQHCYNTRANARQRMANQEQELVRVSSELDDLRGDMGQIMEIL